ncbi:murein L,D-transpeptidase catalytic domain-containing protein [Bacteroides salyersiae]|jgi:hypothetical protein|uniref:murein L,D-transpeptidase catalytic domain-containing protein n=1 Tax=Bacteroides salyersiae TaxID=291644 RepID=UPI001C8CD204|nr:murein L,D-transpeptidase catalytic domain family protein [Bacteroides salyersiae]
MNKPVRFLLVLFLVFIVCFIVRGRCGGSADTFSAGEYNRLKLKADSAKVYCVDKGFNTNYCFLVDFCMHSGKKRFFVWDFRGDSVVYASLCAHGYGKNSTASKPVFSNVEGSYCSSLGRYKVGIRSYSKWGINVHYKLHGLEPTNDNAFKRVIVLHSYDLVPATDIYPVHLPLGISQGCPVICNDVMRKVDKLLKGEAKPVLLWMYR